MSLRLPPTAAGRLPALALVTAVCAAVGAGLAVRRHLRIGRRARERGELLAREPVRGRRTVKGGVVSSRTVNERAAGGGTAGEWAADERTASEERARIARELHDVVAHNVSAMVMQAGAARLSLRPDQVTEREALHVVEETGRAAVEELRRTLGLLRTGAEDDGLAPQPTLARLDDLAERMRAAGLDVRLSVEGEPSPLPVGLDLSAYRIVQAALDNTLRHAGPTTARVRIAYRPRELLLEITDSGPLDGRAGPAGGPGAGLVGVRERVALFHGSLSAGPEPGGGYGVRVVFPLASHAVRPGRVTA
ncbi:sensor histidine kinase [Streptosporangium sandarakinum]|uniref:histidine kinase n=1 Tax=Streptosporangium sandarakinum TaxID=1260955 RepID=A0A852V3R4_9ACTN|nr:histidine kinase [Streptosporangium sandarakinum]NYF41983.1 signal transduction histidine kinase [Streptosporangium sandarakinum]